MKKLHLTFKEKFKYISVFLDENVNPYKLFKVIITFCVIIFNELINFAI